MEQNHRHVKTPAQLQGGNSLSITWTLMVTLQGWASAGMQGTLPKPRLQIPGKQPANMQGDPAQTGQSLQQQEYRLNQFSFCCLDCKWNFQPEVTGLEKSFRTNIILSRDQVSNLLWDILAWSKSRFLFWLISKPEIYWKSSTLDHYWKGFAACMWQNASGSPICLSEEYKMGYWIWIFL